MRESIVDILRCPVCRAERQLRISEAESNEREIRRGSLTCAACTSRFAIDEGIICLLPDPVAHVARETAGLERFAEVMRRDGWDGERIRSLPYVQDGYWFVQATSYNQLVAEVDFKPGERLLDVGSNTCWASNLFARHGLEVVALDIALTEMQGLRTADYFLEDDSADGDGHEAVYFERLQSTMAEPALASATFDYVFCCEVLHHNSLPTLNATLRELHRVLKPGGKLLIINEPMRFPLNLKRSHAEDVADFEGFEHVYFFHQYYRAVRRAGFDPTILAPRYVQFWPGLPEQVPARFTKAAEAFRRYVARTRVLRRSYLAWKTLVAGDVGLNMIATKR
jgi:SAM-dependent methyltransferase/uncharacterized protein YbaR (Trm112 family)